MKTFLAVSAALITVPTIAFVGFSAFYVDAAGQIEQRVRQCMGNGVDRQTCKAYVAHETRERLEESSERLRQASAKLRNTLGLTAD